MFFKNKLQRDFKREMKSVENEMLSREKEGKGAFASKIYKENFYGDTPRRRIPKSKPVKIILITLGSIISIFILLFVIATVDVVMEMNNSSKKALGFYSEGNYEEALKAYNEILKDSEYDFNALHYKGKTLNALGKYHEAIAIFEDAAELRPSHSELYIDYGYSYFYLGNYSIAINHFDKAIEMDSKNSDAYAWKAYSYIYLDSPQKSREFIEQAIKLDEKSAFAYDVKGLISSYEGEYKTAISFFNKAIELNQRYLSAYLNKIDALYSQRSYLECIDFIDSSLKLFPDNVDMIWYKADCFSAQNQFDKSIDEYNRAISIQPANDDLIAGLGLQYLYLQDYSKALEVTNKALQINYNNKFAQNLIKKIDEEKRPDSVKIFELVEKNYLYLDQVPAYKDRSSKFLENKNISAQEVNEFINSIKYGKDVFSYVVYGDAYEELIKQESSSQIFTREMDKNTIYIQIDSFAGNVDLEFKNIIEKIEDTEKKTLVIDLRYNPGGMLIPSTNMLDLLLPECTTSSIVDRKGTIESYYSGESQVKFKKIIIVVNEYSASSSELLALSLKEYLTNVVVIGHPTLGKGVGQITYENKEKKYIIFLVNFYWNVKEKNIAGKGIIPDIIVNGSSGSDYEKVIESELLK